jgi:glycosyltransferase involved in cell wall biosynthesis
MPRAIFAIPGDLASLTGGYHYDREVLARLPDLGIEIAHLALPGGFPAPDAQDLALTQHLFAAAPHDAVLFIDGLAFGACPAALVESIAQPIVALIHHPLALETGLDDARRQTLYASEKAALSKAVHVVVPSPTTKAVLVADYGVPEHRITIALPGTKPAPHAHGSGSTSLAMLAVGSVVPRKGYDVLVEALAPLREEAWALVIAGSLDRAPDHVASLRKLVAAHDLEGRITLSGEVEEDALDALYAAADLFVMSSHYEGYGMVLTEAMARGLPIIVTTGGAAGDTVPDAAALKVAPGDADALRAALRQMLRDAPLRSRLAEASYKAGHALPTWEETARIVADVLARVAEGKSA